MDARRESAARAQHEEHARMPLVPVLVHDEVRLPHPAAAVWELLTDPAREHEMAAVSYTHLTLPTKA